MSQEYYSEEQADRDPVIPGTGSTGDMESPDQPVNLLRRRTFNDELRGLVDRILDNESDSSRLPAADIAAAAIQPDESDLLLKKLHGLFYRMKNLEGLLNNEPFPGAVNHLKDPDILSDPGKLLGEALKRYDIVDYRILYYDRNNRAFISSIKDMEDCSVVGIHDSLFRSVLQSTEGIIVTHDVIADDPFMAKRFPFLAGNPEFSLYINSIYRLTGDDRGRETNLLLTSISPLLVGMGRITEISSRITSALKKDVPMAIKRLVLTSGDVNNPLNVRDHLDMTELLDFCVSLFRETGGITCQIVRVENTISNENLPMIRYLFTRMSRKMPHDSVMIRYNRDSMVLFTRDESLKAVKTTLEEYKNHFEGALTIQTIDMKKENLITMINRLQGL